MKLPNRLERCIKALFAGVLFFPIMLSSCISEEPFTYNSVQDNYNELWTLIDEHYCYLDYKQINWDSIKVEYQKRLPAIKDKEELFNLFGELLRELKDGHVNLFSAFDVSSYTGWYENYPRNYDSDIIANYLDKEYQKAGGILYKKILPNIGYAYIGSFSASISDSNMEYVVRKFSETDGVIIDIRNNGGGSLLTAETVAARCINQQRLVSYTLHKIGKGHSDFSQPFPRQLAPSIYTRFKQPIVILTNRRVYSAANDLVNMLKGESNITILGDTTGGGGGLPMNRELPIGWIVRYSSSPTLDRDLQHIENGIAPNRVVALMQGDIIKGKDTLIEEAIRVLMNNDQFAIPSY